MIQKNDKKVVNAWCMYDWANSVYSLTITTAVFPSYYIAVTGGKNASMKFLWWEQTNSVIYSYALAAAFLLVALLNPLLSGIADYGGYKKRFMQFFSTLGALSCAGLFFFDADPATHSLGVIIFGLAAVGWAGSLVFYNSYLPEIATEDQFDSISAKGFSLGYIGSVLLLIINLLMVMQPQLFFIPVDENGDAGTLPAKISFLTVGVWWLLFAQVTFSRLPASVFVKNPTGNVLTKGFRELNKVWKELKHLQLTKRFLFAFLLYSMGVQTIMYMATIFGEEVVNMEMTELIILVLMLQLIAIAGAYFFSWVSSVKGNIFSLMLSLSVWIGICIAAYFIGEGDKVLYYILGIFVGMVMGGVQSMSRSTYSKFIPDDTEDNTSYFSFYETLEKVSIAAGAFVFGAVRQLTGSMNTSALVLGIFFVLGLWVLSGIPSKIVYAVRKHK